MPIEEVLTSKTSPMFDKESFDLDSESRKTRFGKHIAVCRCINTQPFNVSLNAIFLPPALAEEVMFSVLFVCLSVRVSVCVRSSSLTVRPMDLKVGIHIHLYNISNEFEGQGRRSKVKVIKVKNVDFLIFGILSENEVKGQVTGSRSKVKVKGVITVSTGEREVSQRWGVFISFQTETCLFHLDLGTKTLFSPLQCRAIQNVV